jgi:hypothetical protein
MVVLVEHIAWLRHTTSERWVKEEAGKHHALGRKFLPERDARRANGAKPVDQSLFCSIRLL